MAVRMVLASVPGRQRSRAPPAQLRAALHERCHPVLIWPQHEGGPSVARVVTVTDSVQRRTPKAAKTNSVFKKVVMAVSGIIMVLFLIAHMVGNLHVFQGARSFNHYSEWLRTVGDPALPPRTLLTIIEIVLVLSVVAHMWSAISLWRQAKRARPERYVTKKSVAQTYASRTMRWGGVIIALFIVYHILDLTFGVANPDGTDSTPYDRLVASFQNPFATIVYVVTLILLGMHLRHGIWSATQTLGQSNRRRERSVNIFATAFATLLIAGYLVVPAAVVFGLVD
jgi:succinate dehydrogenase / fumarate reductase, cytochrome b subunit